MNPGKKGARARLDADGSAVPLTRLIATVPVARGVMGDVPSYRDVWLVDGTDRGVRLFARTCVVHSDCAHVVALGVACAEGKGG